MQELLTSVFSGVPLESEFISTTPPIHVYGRDVISVHSPVSIYVTDEFGNETKVEGEGENARIVSEIPGSSYTEIAGGKYVILPSGKITKISINGINGDSHDCFGYAYLGILRNAKPLAFSVVSSTRQRPRHFYARSH